MADSKVADLTVQEFKELVREVVIQTLLEMLGDPDEGLELREDFAAELQRSLTTVEARGKTIPVQEVAIPTTEQSERSLSTLSDIGVRCTRLSRQCAG
jgi:hypothetical protein